MRWGGWLLKFSTPWGIMEQQSKVNWFICVRGEPVHPSLKLSERQPGAVGYIPWVKRSIPARSLLRHSRLQAWNSDAVGQKTSCHHISTLYVFFPPLRVYSLPCHKSIKDSCCWMRHIVSLNIRCPPVFKRPIVHWVLGVRGCN